MKNKLSLFLCVLLAAIIALPVGILNISAGPSVILSDSSPMDIDLKSNTIIGASGTYTADALITHFSTPVKITSPSGEALTGKKPVPCDSVVSAGNESYPIIIYGDINRDGSVETLDVIDLMKYNAGWNIEICSYADLSGSGRVDTEDVILLMKYLAGWNVTIRQAVIYNLSSKDDVIYLKGNIQNSPIKEEDYSKLDEYQSCMSAARGKLYIAAKSDKAISGAKNYIENYRSDNGLISVEKGTSSVIGAQYSVINPVYTELAVEGVKDTYTFMQVTDSHLVLVYDNEPKELIDVAIPRQAWMDAVEGDVDGEYIFPAYFDLAEDMDIDSIWMTGDIIDFITDKNIDVLSDCVKNCSVPSLYMLGNHDYTYGTEYGSHRIRRKYESTFKNIFTNKENEWTPYINYMEYPEFIVVSLDNSDNNFFAGTAAALQKIFDKGKPVIILCHVPFNEKTLAEKCTEVWGSNITIGPGGVPVQSQEVVDIYNMVTADNSPVIAVFAGHVHFDSEAVLPNGVLQYTTDAGYLGTCRIITVKGK